MKNFISLVLAVLSLAGCAELSPYLTEQVADETAWDSRKIELEHFDKWTITGRVAVQSGQEGWSATLHWDQDHDRYNMRFIAPLGQGTYELEGGPERVSLLTAENRTFNAEDPESLLLDNLGWSVPLHGLKYWIKGVPEPGINTENLLLDDQGRLTDMQQSGWRISISRYSDFNGTQLPSRLYMHNDRFKLRLVVDDWKTSS